LWPVIVAVLIFGASGRSQVADPGIPNLDKIVHFSVYGLLATLVVRARAGGRAWPWMALVITSLYGITDEIHQSYVPGRSMEFADWIADTLGAAVAIFIYTKWTWYRTRLEMPLRRDRRIENSKVVERVPVP
jgi:VanZ family protein